MVKAVQAEDALSNYFDALLKDRVPAEVGSTCRRHACGIGTAAHLPVSR
jgi:hypothetical protein